MTGSRRRVVITGLGLVTSLGIELQENWQKALAGVPGITKLSYPAASKAPVQAVGEVQESDWKKIVTEFQDDAAQESEKRTLFALWATKRALEDAGALSSAGSRDRYGVMMAAGLGISRLEDISRWAENKKQFNVARFSRELELVHRESTMRNNSHRPAALMARRFGLRGINGTITAACASATQAIGVGYRAIQRRDADLIVAGGADSMINPVGFVFFVLLNAGSTSSDNPSAVCRPFDRKRSGLVMGEGSGVAVLEEESHALKRGARIYCEVVGYGASMDAYQVTAPEPKGNGAIQSMTAALADSGISAEGIDYINAHGTSTKLNDVAETLAIKAVFGEHAKRLAVSSTKSLIGHLLAGSGGPEFVFTVLSVQRDEVHPTINLTNPDPKCDLDYVPNVKRSMTVRAALSNSFGFGGQNGSIIVRKYGGAGR